MNGLLTLAVVLFLTIIVPLYIIFHFTTKWKQAREISTEDEQMLEDLYLQSQRMEERLETLERILDDQLPEWRNRR